MQSVDVKCLHQDDYLIRWTVCDWQTQRYLNNMQDDTQLTEKTLFLLDRVRIPNNVNDSCHKHYISPLLD